MMLGRCNPMMNASWSAANGAGDSCSCAYFQDSNANFTIISMDTMVMVSIFLILALAIVCGALARLIPVIMILCLVSVLIYKLNTP